MIITTLVFLTVIWLAYKSYIIRKYPPGPFPLPIIGNLHLLRKDIHLAMDKLSKEYGTMFTLWMADKPFIVITDYDLAKKVCITKRYADRLPLYVGDVVYSRGSKDIIMGDYSDSLILHRKLAQSAFQMFGDEMESLEVRVLDNLQTFFKTCNQHIEDPKFQIFHDVEHTFFNVMSTIVLGEKIRKDCDRFLKIRQAVFYMMQSGVTLSMVNFYPVLRYLPNPELTKMIKVIQERDDVLQNLVSKIERDYDMENKPSNYIEALLRSKMENSDAENNNVENGDKKQFVDFTRDHLEMNVFDMFLAGVETVAVSATWSILFLMKWPEVQEKCHQHLDRIKGPKTDDGIQMPVRLEDKQHLPYFMAVIYETLRLASTLPFGVFHKARENTTLNGFNIEKGTPFMINLWTIHHDPKNFKDPLQFNPDRFLDQDGSLLPSSKIKNFLAFSAGPRQCIGQTIAKSELFLFLTNFLYNFKLENSPLNKELSTNGNTKVTHAPKPFNVCLKHRC